MYILLSAALISSGIGWYMESGIVWLSGLALSIFLMLYTNMKHLFHDSFLTASLGSMSDTACCLSGNACSSPKTVMTSFCMIRSAAGLSAIIAVFFTWLYRSSFMDKQYGVITVCWCVTSGLWILSCVPLAVCLIQCASNPTLNNKKEIPITHTALILRFRKAITMWIIHDLFLGIFWMYLSLMLYDLTDDEDDSEWRTIFLSMLSWHIVVIILRQIYFKGTWSINRATKPSSERVKPCCSIENAEHWWDITCILCYVLIYGVFILRMQSGSLINMGCSLESVVLFIVAIVLVCISKEIPKKIDTKTTAKLRVTKLVHLDF